MSRLIAAALAAAAVALSCTAAATASGPPDQTGDGAFRPGESNGAFVLHCQSFDGSPGVIVFNHGHPNDPIGSCDLGG